IWNTRLFNGATMDDNFSPARRPSQVAAIHPVAVAFSVQGQVATTLPPDEEREVLEWLKREAPILAITMDERISQATNGGKVSVRLDFVEGSIEVQAFVQILEWIALAGGVVQAVEYLAKLVEVVCTETITSNLNHYRKQYLTTSVDFL